MWCRALSVPIGIIILLTVGGGFALAEDAPVEGAVAPGEDAIAVPEAEIEGSLETEIEKAPVYEDEYEEDLRERYFRISQDFIKPQLLGLGRIGEVRRWPHGMIKAGPFRFSPYLTAALGWQSNAFLQEDDEKSTWFYETRFGLTGDGSFLKDKLTIRGTGEFYYRNYTREGVHDDWEGVFGLSTKYTLPVGVWVEAGAVYTRLFDPVDEEDVPTRMRRDQMDYFLDMGLDEAFQRLVGRSWKLELGFDFRTRNFHDEEFSLGDRVEWDTHLRLSYVLREDLDVYVEGTYGQIQSRSKRLNDSWHWNVDFGLDGSIDLTSSGRLQGQIFVGYRADVYDETSAYQVGSQTFFTEDNEDGDQVTAGLQLRYLMGTRTTLTALYTRTTTFSLKGNYQNVDRFDMSASYIVMDGLSARISGYYEWDQPSNVADVYRYGAGAGVRYSINDFVDADLSYDVRWRNDMGNPSEFPYARGVDYEDHRVILAVTFYLR